MKTLKLNLLFSILFLVSYAQEGDSKNGRMYFTFKAGYSIGVANSTIGSPRSEVGNRILVSSTDGDYSFSQKNPFGSRGAGAQIATSFAYMISKNFGVEMEFSFLRSSKILDASRDETNDQGFNYFAEQYSYTNMFRAAPMLVVSGSPDNKFIPYAKFGILLPLAGKTIVEVNINDGIGELAEQILPLINPELAAEFEDLPIGIPTTSFIKAKTAGSFSVGFAARLGCEYAFNSNWSIFGEMEMNMLTIKAKETKFTEFSTEVPAELVAVAEQILDKEPGSIQGTYGLYDLPEILRLTVYENEITEASNYTYDVNSPSFNKDAPFQQVTFRDNYNSFGLMFGFKYRFK
ncbi:MAG: outer membrane beta-barrel protein [Chitinophagales bacterium]|nr:outer membrane beta-barrel protein [Chitinophagales bacterium]